MKTKLDRIETAQAAEAEAWREVLRLLQAGGAVTDADCLLGASGLTDTYGQILLNQIRTWGKTKQELGGAREARPTPSGSQLSFV